MKRAVFLHIESILREYPRMSEYIENRKNNIYYSPDDDRVVNTLRWQQGVIKDCIQKSTEDDLEVIDALYFHHDPNQTLDGAAIDLHISRSTLFYRRNKFLEAVRHGLGW